jgi:hypothetical protein
MAKHETHKRSSSVLVLASLFCFPVVTSLPILEMHFCNKRSHPGTEAHLHDLQSTTKGATSCCSS